MAPILWAKRDRLFELDDALVDSPLSGANLP
jgi:hypothetical protein